MGLPELCTYRSRASPGMFVTMRAAEAAAIMVIVEQVVALKPDPHRWRYAMRDGELGDRFLDLVAARITMSGYAVHPFHLALRSPGDT